MRVLFSKGKQRKFINKILSKVSVKEAAKICNLSQRTIRDWRREKFLMDLNALRKICKKASIKFPSHIELRDDYWYVAHGSSAGGMAVLKKYGRVGGDPEYRKKKWREWWERKGRYLNRSIFKRKPINKPPKSSDLAEFVGIMLGDGGITSKQVHITLHNRDDKEYIKFVCQIIKKLFNRTPNVNKHRCPLVSRIVVSSMDLIDYLIGLGLKRGNKIKQQIDIPGWIKRDKQYAIACLRGLIDTDGCIFTHKYKVNGKWYSYKKLAFASHSQSLRQSLFNILKNNGLSPRFAQEKDVRLDSIKDMQRYFKIFNSHNSKHLNKYFR